MSEETGQTADQKNAEGPEYAVVVRKKGISPIWILPLVAALLGIWLAAQGILTKPIEISILFDSGAGIVPDKTKVMYRGVPVGKVSAVRFHKNLKQVVATVEMDHRTDPVLMEGTQFWLVKPQVSIAEVSGLETLVSGNYISLRLSTLTEKTPSRYFVALPEPPRLAEDEPGLRLNLITSSLDSLSVGSPISYRKIRVGAVESYALSEDGGSVVLGVFIQPEYAYLVNSNTRFWNPSGITVEGGLSGFSVRTETLASMIRGGISFDTPPDTGPGVPVEDYTTFELFPDIKAASTGIPITIDLKKATGLVAGKTRVQYNGIQVGFLEKVEPLEDFSGVRAHMMMDPSIEPFLMNNTRFWLVKPNISLEGVTGLDTIIQGKYFKMDARTDGHPARSFVALDAPPPPGSETGGLIIELVAENLGSITQEAPIYYKQFRVGKIHSYRLDTENDRVIIQGFIEKPYRHLVNQNSRFWNAGGISVKAGLSSVRVRTQSLASIWSGGVAFSTPDDPAPAAEARQGHRFILHESEEKASWTGIPLKIHFKHDQRLEAGTDIRFAGVSIGKVVGVSYDEVYQNMIADVRITRDADIFTSAGTQYWLATASVNLASGVSNLETLVTGPYIAALPPPTKGKRQQTFYALAKPPRTKVESTGLNFRLTADRLGSIQAGNRIFYKDIAVGEVLDTELSDDARSVIIYANIEPEYAPLVREQSVFWNVSGFALDASLFRGVSVRASSLESLLAGGIAFATPEKNPGGSIPEHALFKLHDEPEEAWQAWSPKIPLKR